MSVLALYKNEGETPLECLERERIKGKISKDEKATYAGRLDPMAEGVLLVLTGEDVHEKEKYLKLPKVYEVEVLFGVSTDTGDVLGIIRDSNFSFLSNNFSSPRISQYPTAPDYEKSEEGRFLGKIKEILEDCVGEFEEEYPKFSSKPLHGKPLFFLTRLGKIFDSPKHKVKINSINLKNVRVIKIKNIAEESIERIRKVKGDFRQEKIIESWQNLSQKFGEQEAQIIRIEVSCESGAYMRVLAEKIGKKLNIPALALRIKRIKIGEFTF